MTHGIVPAGSLNDGEHACCFYDSDEQQHELLADFIHTGIASGHRVVCVGDAASTRRILEECVTEPRAQAAIAGGQLEVTGSEQMYIAGGYFDPDRLPGRWQQETDRALDAGFAGVRVTGDVTWYTRELPGVGRLMEYEHALSEILAEMPASALCQYDRRRLDDDLLAEAEAAHGTLTGVRHPVAADTFRVLRVGPATYQLVGELDIAGTPALADALGGALADGTTRINIDLSGLSFLDAGGATALVQPAREHGVALDLRHPQRGAQTVLSLLELDQLPGVRVLQDPGR